MDLKAAGRAPPNIRKNKWWGTEDHAVSNRKGFGGQNGKSSVGKSSNADPPFKKISIRESIQ